MNALGANKSAAGNAVGLLAVCRIKRFGDRTVTPHANRFAGMSRASASGFGVQSSIGISPTACQSLNVRPSNRAASTPDASNYSTRSPRGILLVSFQEEACPADS